MKVIKKIKFGELKKIVFLTKNTISFRINAGYGDYYEGYYEGTYAPNGTLCVRFYHKDVSSFEVKDGHIFDDQEVEVDINVIRR